MKHVKSAIIIDDNFDDCEIAKRILVRSKIVLNEKDLFVARNGREGIEFLKDYLSNEKRYGKKFPPDLIFLDINMPEMGGFEFLENYKELANDKRYDSQIVVMLSSSSQDEDKENALKYPFVKDYFEKPLLKEKAIELINRFF